VKSHGSFDNNSLHTFRATFFKKWCIGFSSKVEKFLKNLIFETHQKKQLI